MSLDSAGNQQVDFAWGNMPMQPNTGRAISLTSEHTIPGGSWNTFGKQSFFAADNTTIKAGDVITVTGFMTPAEALNREYIVESVEKFMVAGNHVLVTTTPWITDAVAAFSESAKMTTDISGNIGGGDGDYGWSKTTKKKSLQLDPELDNHVIVTTNRSSYPSYEPNGPVGPVGPELIYSQAFTFNPATYENSVWINMQLTSGQTTIGVPASTGWSVNQGDIVRTASQNSIADSIDWLVNNSFVEKGTLYMVVLPLKLTPDVGDAWVSNDKGGTISIEVLRYATTSAEYVVENQLVTGAVNCDGTPLVRIYDPWGKGESRLSINDTSLTGVFNSIKSNNISGVKVMLTTAETGEIEYASLNVPASNMGTDTCGGANYARILTPALPLGTINPASIALKYVFI